MKNKKIISKKGSQKLQNTKKKKPLKRIKHEILSDYLHSIYEVEEFNEKINAVVEKLRAIRRRNSFDAIAVRGVSGMGMGFPISYLLKIPLINIRKIDQDQHYLD